MIVPAKSIPLHPSRIHSLKPGEIFDISSGMGGSFTVRFDGYDDGFAGFTIVSSCPPPDGWNGEKRSFPTDRLAHTLYGHAPESQFFDEGKAELIMLAHLGYPKDSPEITSILKRFPKVAEKLATLDHYFTLHDSLTKTTKHERHAAAHHCRPAKYSAKQAPLVAEMEAIEASFKTRSTDHFNTFHKVWLATR